MDDLKKGAREGEVNAKEAWRNSDGEDLSDKVGIAVVVIRMVLGNLGDDARNALDNAGDAVDRTADKVDEKV